MCLYFNLDKSVIVSLSCMEVSISNLIASTQKVTRGPVGGLPFQAREPTSQQKLISAFHLPLVYLLAA